MSTVQNVDYADNANPPSIDLPGPQTRKSWGVTSKVRLFFDLAGVWAQILFGISITVLYPSWLTWILGVLLVGGGQHALGLISHECAHGLVIPSDRKWNDRIGAWIFAGPGGIPFELYKQRHFAHHRTYSTERDTKRLYRRDFSGWKMGMEIVKSLSGWDYFVHVRDVLSRARTGPSESTPGNGLLGLIPLLGSQLVILAVLCAIDPVIYLSHWVLPQITVAVLCSKLRSTVEHLPLRSESGKESGSQFFAGTRFPFVRTVHASLVERLFFSKINFSFHAEHHLWPDVPYQVLPVAHQELTRLRSVGFGREQYVLADSYFGTLLKLWRGL